MEIVLLIIIACLILAACDWGAVIKAIFAYDYKTMSLTDTPIESISLYQWCLDNDIALSTAKSWCRDTTFPFVKEFDYIEGEYVLLYGDDGELIFDENGNEFSAELSEVHSEVQTRLGENINYDEILNRWINGKLPFQCFQHNDSLYFKLSKHKKIVNRVINV